MVSTPGPTQSRRTTSLVARAGAVLAGAAVFAVALPTIGTLLPDTPLPSPATYAAEDVRLDKPSVPVRIQVPYAGIDLPVVSSERTVPGNARNYPLCDVAQYWTRYDLPGAPGTTWIYAHAQPGMFLPLLTVSEATDGKGLLGKIVEIQTRDKRLLTYRITQVKERAINRKIAVRQRATGHRLILQTSTGPPGTIPKLQAAARLVGARRATEPAPKAKPRACWQARPVANRTPKKPKATPTPTAEVVEAGDEPDVMVMALGSGAVLMGAVFIAVYMVRRQP